MEQTKLARKSQLMVKLALLFQILQIFIIFAIYATQEQLFKDFYMNNSLERVQISDMFFLIVPIGEFVITALFLVAINNLADAYSCGIIFAICAVIMECTTIIVNLVSQHIIAAKGVAKLASYSAISGMVGTFTYPFRLLGLAFLLIGCGMTIARKYVDGGKEL